MTLDSIPPAGFHTLSLEQLRAIVATAHETISQLSPRDDVATVSLDYAKRQGVRLHYAGVELERRGEPRIRF